VNPITLDDAMDTIQGALAITGDIDTMLEVWQCDGEAAWCAWLRDRPREGDGSLEVGRGPTMRAAIVDLARQLARKR
jgi:hypothetical protein